MSTSSLGCSSADRCGAAGCLRGPSSCGCPEARLCLARGCGLTLLVLFQQVAALQARKWSGTSDQPADADDGEHGGRRSGAQGMRCEASPASEDLGRCAHCLTRLSDGAVADGVFHELVGERMSMAKMMASSQLGTSTTGVPSMLLRGFISRSDGVVPQVHAVGALADPHERPRARERASPTGWPGAR